MAWYSLTKLSMTQSFLPSPNLLQMKTMESSSTFLMAFPMFFTRKTCEQLYSTQFYKRQRRRNALCSYLDQVLSGMDQPNYFAPCKCKARPLHHDVLFRLGKMGGKNRLNQTSTWETGKNMTCLYVDQETNNEIVFITL